MSTEVLKETSDRATARSVLRAGEDRSGRDRLVLNVGASWAGHAVFIAAGLLMPRLLDRDLGQEFLGVWDFAWSVVGYLGLIQIGVGSSINRFVARHRSQGDVDELSRTVSSAIVVQATMAVCALVATGLACWLVVRSVGIVGDEAGTARWVLLLLGSAFAVQLATDTFRGVITGCHRWDVHNALNAGFYLLAVCGMALALFVGGSLVAVAAVYASGMVLTEVARVIVARRVCPELRLDVCKVSWARARQLLVFGSKMAVADASSLVLIQTNAMSIAAFLGPAALATFARSQAIRRHLDTVLNKLAFVLVPAAGALEASNRKSDLRELFVTSTRLSAALTATAVVTLACAGDVLLRLWMGARYSDHTVLAIIALGSLLPLSQRPSIQILVGLNMHGRVAVATAVCTAVTLVIGWHAPVRYGLVGAAFVLVGPTTIAEGIVVPILACRQLGIALKDYVVRVVGPPFFCVLPYAALLWEGRHLFAEGERSVAMLTWSAAVATAIVLGWRIVLTASQREWVLTHAHWKLASQNA